MTWSPFTVEASATSPRWVRLLLLVARLSAAFVMAVSAAAMVGWAEGIWWLTDPVRGFPPMSPDTAFLLLLAGLSLGLSVSASRAWRWAAKVLAALGTAMAFTVLAQDVVGAGFHASWGLFLVPGTLPPIPTTFAIVLANVALLVLDARPRCRVGGETRRGPVLLGRGPALSEVLATIVAVIGWLVVGGYLYGAIQFYRWAHDPHITGMAINTAVALIVLAMGIVAARPESGAMATFASRYVGGEAARKMLPLTLLIPAVGWLAVRAQKAGLYEWPGAAVVEGVAAMLVVVVITFAVGRSLDRSDAQRRVLEAQNREWKRFFDRATFGAVMGTGDARFGAVNDAFAHMHGYASPAELEGRPVADVFPPERHAELFERMDIATERGHCRWESEHVRRDGTVFPVVIDVSTVRDDEGNLLYRAAYVQDITEEKEAEAVRWRLASLVQSSDDAIVTEALDDTVLDWNQGAERVFGYAAEEMVGRSVVAIVSEDRRAERDGIKRRVLAGEIIVGLEAEGLRKDGRRIPIAVTMSPIRDAIGRVVGISAIARDISALKQLEREREEWAAVVAHDLRQPTATIELVASALARKETEPSRQRGIERIRSATLRLERMIADLLDVSRVASRRLEVKPETVTLRPLVAEAIELLPELAGRCRIAIAPDAACASADPGRFVQVLSNLLSNAHKYGDPGTSVEVSVDRVDAMIRVTVTNEGPGIAPDELPKLFSRFARTRSAQSGAVPGLGLGLYICRGIVESLGGTLWVESVPGEKTHVRFTLRPAPDAWQPATRAQEPAAEQAPPAWPAPPAHAH
jgi:PAS domain S-box-containing protein